MSTGPSHNCGNDATSHSSLPFISLQIDLPASERARAQHLTNSYRRGSSTARLIVSTNQCSTNPSHQACLGPSPKNPLMLLLPFRLHLFYCTQLPPWSCLSCLSWVARMLISPMWLISIVSHLLSFACRLLSRSPCPSLVTPKCHCSPHPSTAFDLAIALPSPWLPPGYPVITTKEAK